MKQNTFLILLSLFLGILPSTGRAENGELVLNLFRPRLEVHYTGLPSKDLTDTSADRYGTETAGINFTLPLGKAHVNIASGFSGYQWLLNAGFGRTNTLLTLAADNPEFTQGSLTATGLFLSKSKNLYIASFGVNFDRHTLETGMPELNLTGMGIGTTKTGESTYLLYGGFFSRISGRFALVPGLGFHMKFDEHNSLLTLLPLFFQYTHTWNKKHKIDVYLGADGMNHSFVNSGEFPSYPETVRMTETAGKVGSTYTCSLSGNIALSTEAGFRFLRVLRFMDGKTVIFDSDIETCGYIGIKFSFTFGKSLAQQWLGG